MRIVGATGNVLIGSSTTDDTTNKLQVTGSGKFTSTLSVGNPSALGTLSIGSDGTTTNQIRLTHTGLGTNGSFDIGITSTTANLVANYATTPISMAFFTGAVERLKIDASGYIVTSSVTYGNTTGSAANMYIFGVGDYGIGRSVSSIKYKTQIEDIEKKYVDNLYKMRPIWYRSLCEKDKKEWSHFGFIAEEMEKIEPRFVHYNKDEQGNEFAEGVQYDRITALLVKAVQELKAEIDALKNN